jgi:hypothetical protein
MKYCFTNEVIRSLNPIRTDIEMTKRKRINKDLQNITQKTKDRATGIPLWPFIGIFKLTRAQTHNFLYPR